MSQTICCNGIEIRLDAELGGFAAELTCRDGAEPGLFDVVLRVTADEPERLPQLKLLWDLPSVDLHHKWNPACYQNRALDPSTGSANHFDSKANTWMPVYCLYNLAGVNVCTWALSDVIHDTKIGGAYRHGKFYRCKIEIQGETIGAVSSYEAVVRFDFRRIPYYESLRGVSRWWEAIYPPCSIPDAARMPLLSSWYSYLLELDPDDLERQCEAAKKIGIRTVILDDGWQTAQLTPGYQNSGDWEVCTNKFPDFAAHVRRVQAMGMKYMVWFSVPFVGVESQAYHRFHDMLMPGRENATHYALDFRFSETRAYIADTFEQFLRRYGVDGFKMDFIGSTGLGPCRGVDPRHDCESVGEGVCKLLDDLLPRLRAINPDVLVEFRQAYIGPAMRRYANMFRAVDCPNSIGDNRVRTLDVRLMCGNTVAHADPITWHDDDPPHSAAMQIIHALFSVPQISRKITELTEPHRRMLRQQIAFFLEHRDVLLQGELRPLHPHELYPLVVTRNDLKLLAAFYANRPLTIDEGIPEQLILVNGSYAAEVLIDLVEPLGLCTLTVVSCCGETLCTENVEYGAGMHRVQVPPAAHAVIRRTGK